MVIVLLVTAILLGRMVLVVSGLLKGPVLHTFERYGDHLSDLYTPLPALLFYTGIFSYASGIIISKILPYTFVPWEAFSIILVIGAAVSWEKREYAHRFFRYPRWYYDLLDRTSRYERRRIAYMWLHLSPRARLNYNSNSRAFLEWADFIILSTLYI